MTFDVKHNLVTRLHQQKRILAKETTPVWSCVEASGNFHCVSVKDELVINGFLRLTSIGSGLPPCPLVLEALFALVKRQ